MQPDFWHDLWHRGQIAFHQPSASEYLNLHWRDLDVPSTSRVFVPLCGKSLDMVWFRERDYAVVGLELSSVAVQAFCMENGIPARRRMDKDFDVYLAEHLELWCGNFFSLTVAELGAVTAVYDRAALISWDAQRREPYARHMATLTPRGVKTLLITLEYDQAEMAGPPFSVDAAEVHRLYGAHHTIASLSRHDIFDQEPRWRARGLTQLHEACYQLTRL